MKRALVVRRGGLGDTVLMAPVLAAISSRGFAVDFAGSLDFARLFSRHGLVARVVSSEDLELWALPLEGAAGDRARARLSSYDLVFADGLETGTGFGTRRAFSFDPVPRERGVHRVHVSTHLLRQLSPALLADVTSLDPAPRLLAARVPTAPEREVLLHPGSGSLAKCWDPSRFAQVSRALRRRGRRVAVVLGEAEASRAETLLAPFGPDISVIREPDIADLAARIERAACFVGNDSGPAHLAAALQVPTVTIFGPTDPLVWAPLGPHVRVVGRDVDQVLDAIPP